MSAHFDPAAARSAADARPGAGRTLRQAQGERALQRDRERKRVGEGVPPGASEGAAPSAIADAVREGPAPPAGADPSRAAPSAASASLRETAAPASQPLGAPARASEQNGREPATASPSAPTPDQPPSPRPDLFTPERRARFLAALAETGSARAACARVGVSPECVYRLRRREPLFAAGWDGALVLARRVAEDVLAHRALEGVEEPVFYRGEQIGSRLRFDARLLLAHLARLDGHVAASRHGAGRAERFDELLALVAGTAPPAALGEEPPAASADPVLPPSCEVHVDRQVDRLPRRASFTAQAARAQEAAAEWHGWQAAARAVADRLVPLRGVMAGAGAGAGAGAASITLSTVSTAALGRGLMAGPG